MAALITFVMLVTQTQVTVGPDAAFAPTARTLLAYVDAGYYVPHLIITDAPDYLDDGRIVCGWGSTWGVRLFTGDRCGQFMVGSLFHELAHAHGVHDEAEADRWGLWHAPDRWQGHVRALLHERGTDVVG